MLFKGQYFNILTTEPGIAELVFDTAGKPNILSQQSIQELGEAISVLKQHQDLNGLLIRSGKKDFCLGADITEFTQLFRNGDEAELKDKLQFAHSVMNAIEDLPVPVVAAVAGNALGGGCELALTADFRIVGTSASLGLPEVRLGIIPGWGGTVRLPRIVGVEKAIELITGSKTVKATDALHFGMVDGVVDDDNLQASALATLKRAIAGELDWQGRKEECRSPMNLSEPERNLAIATASGLVSKAAGKFYVAPMAALNNIAKNITQERDQALSFEREAFTHCAQTEVAQCLIGIYLADTAVKARGRQQAGEHRGPETAAIIGAGIMGGGIAYQSASKGVRVTMKDINQSALELGMSEVSGLLLKRLSKKRIKPEQMVEVLNRIVPTLHEGPVTDAEVIVEAVVERMDIKHSVLKHLEQITMGKAVLTSNTSTLPISKLANALERPENFCGMHFFNPVHMMPMVEVIRGEKTSDETIAKVVAYARKIGKTPIVVGDCPGFYVNRLLVPYFLAFNSLLVEGVEMASIDKAMEKGFGWPMGPAYLADVIGMDTCVHVMDTMSNGYPDRMALPEVDAFTLMNDAERFGQKNSKGFYCYEKDRRGRLKKKACETSVNRLADVCAPAKEVTADTVVERMMLPMLFEAVRALDDGIIACVEDGDMAMVYGAGFPPFRGGLFRYMDNLGLAEVVRLSDQYRHLGKLYDAPASLRAMAAEGQTYYP